MNDDIGQHEFQHQINLILKKASSLLQEKNYKEAAAIVAKGFEAYPKQKDLLDLFAEIKKQYKNDKIQKLQEEAVMFLRTGAEDKAQEKFRQILQLDPSRTDLKDSLQKSRAEIVAEYNYSTEKMQLIRLGYKVLLAILVILCSIALWAWWSNDRCLNESEKLIDGGNLRDARLTLKKCGWFLAGGKQKVNERLQSAINELIDRASHCAESKDFQRAKEYLGIAAQATENSSPIAEQIRKYDQLELQWKKELAKQEEERGKQRVLSEKALIAKKEFRRALEQSLGNKADVEAKDIIEIAKNKAQAAENLFSQKQFESAEKQWLSAIEDCKKVLKIAETTELTKANKTVVSAFKLKCEQATVSAFKINAPAEASEIWQEAEKIHNSAEQNFAQNDFNAADRLWQQAADKYDEAIKKCPSYKKALLMQQKWQNLKQGIKEEDVKNILGNPKCVQAASDHCIWFYQVTPIASMKNEGNYECINPQCGYVRFGIVKLETIIEKNKEIYQKYMNDENNVHASALASMAKQIQDENDRHKSFRISNSVTNPVGRTDPYRGGTRTYNGRSERTGGLQTNDVYRAERKGHESMIQQIEAAQEKEKQRHGKQIEKYSQDLQTKINNLANGLFPIAPRYIVSDWILPDNNDLVSLLRTEEPNERRIKPPYKWQMPIKWKSLRLNIKEDEAFSILGSPQETSSENGGKVYHYGKIAKYGYLTFEDSTDSVRRLRYWKEPLWTHVAQELQNERQLSDPNQKTDFHEPNEPNEPDKPDANDVDSLALK